VGLTPPLRSIDKDDSGKSFIFFALYVPDADPELDDADDLAHCFVSIINEERQRNADDAGRPDCYQPVMVAGIPSPQWLNPATLANLRAAASGRPVATPDQSGSEGEG